MTTKTAVLQPQKTSTLQKFMKNLVQYRWFYLFILPAVVYFLLFKYFPIVLGITISFKNYSPFAGRGFKAIFSAPSAGFYHYQRLFTQQDFYRVLGNTLRISIKKLLITFPAPIIFALLLNEVRHVMYKRVIQTVSYLPHFISIVVIAGMVRMLLQEPYGTSAGGPLFYVLEALGLRTDQPFLAQKEYFDGILIGMGLWQGFGWGSIVYLSALTGIDTGLYEAAEIDGAGKFKQMWYITLPGIAPTIVVMLIMQVGKILDAGYQDILLLYSELTYSVADVFDTYIYRLGIQEAQYGLTSALGLFKSIVGTIMVVGTNKLANLFGESGLW